MMQKKIAISVVGVLGFMALVFVYSMSKDSNDKDHFKGATVPIEHSTEIGEHERNSLVTGHDMLKQAESHVAPVASIDMESQNRKNLPRHSIIQENTPVNDSYSGLSEQKLARALKNIPINYHAVLQWHDDQDEVLINEYIEVIESDVATAGATELIAENRDELLSNFFYQHELSLQIALEYMGCNSAGCIIYGAELQTGVWNQLLESAKSQPWWDFSKDTTRTTTGSDGNLVFFTVIR